MWGASLRLFSLGFAVGGPVQTLKINDFRPGGDLVEFVVDVARFLLEPNNILLGPYGPSQISLGSGRYLARSSNNSIRSDEMFIRSRDLHQVTTAGRAPFGGSGGRFFFGFSRVGPPLPRNRPRIVRNRCVPVCGSRAGYCGLGLAQL